MSLKNDWKNWCRTCGRNNLLTLDCYSKWDSLDEDSLAIMRKLTLLDIEMTSSKRTDNNICIDCHGFLKAIVKFSKQCIQITDMYAEINLDYESIGDCDLLAVRSRYGLKDDDDDDDDEVISLKNPFDDGNHSFNPNEFVKIEIKLEDIQENVKQEYIYTNSIIPNENYSDIRDTSSKIHKKKTKPNSTSTRKRKIKEDNINILGNSQDTVTDNTNIQTNETNGLPPRPLKIVKKKIAPKKTKIKKSINCPICKSAFNEQLECELHMNANHSVIDYPFNCSKCPKRFVSARELQVHEQKHLPHSKKSRKDKFVCEQCGKICKRYTNLKSHFIVHSNECTFECIQCLKKFKSPHSLQRHRKIHDRIVYKCDVCGLQFNAKYAIIAHMVVHSDIKKFKCNYCGKGYKRRRALKNHLIYHSGLKPYKCPFCDKTFTYGTSCRLHKKTVHPKELAELEASGKILPSANLPKFEYLQPK